MPVLVKLTFQCPLPAIYHHTFNNVNLGKSQPSTAMFPDCWSEQKYLQGMKSNDDTPH